VIYKDKRNYRHARPNMDESPVFIGGIATYDGGSKRVSVADDLLDLKACFAHLALKGFGLMAPDIAPASFWLQVIQHSLANLFNGHGGG